MTENTEHLSFSNLDNQTLKGILQLPSQPTDTCVICCHGFGSNKEFALLWHICEELTSKGFAAFRFDFSGCGESEGDFAFSTYVQQIHDLHAAMDFISKKGFSRLALVGHSMGGAVSLLVTSRDERIKAVVDMAGPSHPSRDMVKKFDITKHEQTQHYHFNLGTKTYKLSQRFIDDLDKANIEEAVKSITVPLLFVHGTLDRVVGVEESQHLLDVATSSVKDIKVIDDASHLFTKHKEDVATLVSNWLEKNL